MTIPDTGILPAISHADSIIEIFLNPGEYFVGGSGFQVRTLLGSCVSITLWHPRLQFGTISHYLLPCRNQAPVKPDAPGLDGKYGDEAIILMIDALHDVDIPITGCQAKIFGGGNMFPDCPINKQLDVGLRNGEMARKLMAQHHIPVVAEALFGYGHREIIFNLSNGEVWMRQLKLPFSAQD